MQNKLNIILNIIPQIGSYLSHFIQAKRQKKIITTLDNTSTLLTINDIATLTHISSKHVMQTLDFLLQQQVVETVSTMDRYTKDTQLWKLK